MEHTAEFIETITEEWILAQMEELGLKRKNIIEDIGFTKSYLSRLFAKEDAKMKIHLTTAVKALFYFYFKTKRTT